MSLYFLSSGVGNVARTRWPCFRCSVGTTCMSINTSEIMAFRAAQYSTVLKLLHISV
jgi:hypothetical protein